MGTRLRMAMTSFFLALSNTSEMALRRRLNSRARGAIYITVPAILRRQLHKSACLKHPRPPLPGPTPLLTLLHKRAADGKDGLGFEVGSPAIAAARSSLLHAISSEEKAPEAIAGDVCDHYQSLGGNMEQKKAFFSVLAGDLGVDHEGVLKGVEKLRDLYSQHRSEATLLKSEANLRGSMTPFYCDLFSLIARLEGGIKFLVDLRGDLLDTISDSPSDLAIHNLSEMNSHLRSILAQWFSVGLLDLHKVTWETPCDIMEKISQYEAVHPFRHWRDLKHRVGPNRRCFTFSHRAFPRDPIVVLHAALTRDAAYSIQALLDRSQHEDPEDITTAVFYSISATQRGLSGVELGRFLIRKVVQELKQEFPDKLKHFVTLSPIPGFRKWLCSHLKLHNQQGLEGCQVSREELNEVLQLFPRCNSPLEALQTALTTWVAEPRGPLGEVLRQPLTSLCARYLAHEKRRRRALDPVAHFHLHNGASIWRLNWLGDLSPSGLQRSYGLMANYRYHLPDMAMNSNEYHMNGTAAVSDSLQGYL